MARAMPDVLIWGDTLRHAELRHEIPLDVPDPFLYAEVDGARHVVVASIECGRIAALAWVLVTEDGGGMLTDFPSDLEP